jgi:hypothetical protein
VTSAADPAQALVQIAGRHADGRHGLDAFAQQPTPGATPVRERVPSRVMTPVGRPLRLYGRVADVEGLPWTWVDERLAAAPTYWVTAGGVTRPHPRPVWGVWTGTHLLLSVGSPTLAASLADDATLAVNLESATEVVVLEGRVADRNVIDETAIALYDTKYEWHYDITEYGPLLAVAPERVHAWESKGWAGRDGFVAGATFEFGPDRVDVPRS